MAFTCKLTAAAFLKQNNVFALLEQQRRRCRRRRGNPSGGAVRTKNIEFLFQPSFQFQK